MKSTSLNVVKAFAAHKPILLLLFIANVFVPLSLLKGLVQELPSDFQFVRCALFLARCDVTWRERVDLRRAILLGSQAFPRSLQASAYGG